VKNQDGANQIFSTINMGSLRTLLGEGLLERRLLEMALDFDVAQIIIQEALELTQSGKLEWRIITPFATIHPTDGNEMVWLATLTRDFDLAITSYNRVALLEDGWPSYSRYERLDLIKHSDQPKFDTRNLLNQDIMSLKDTVLKRFPPHQEVDEQRLLRNLARNSRFLKVRNTILKKLDV
jgi:hypothetical protein